MKDKSNTEKSEENAARLSAEQASPPPVNGSVTNGEQQSGEPSKSPRSAAGQSVRSSASQPSQSLRSDTADPSPSPRPASVPSPPPRPASVPSPPPQPAVVEPVVLDNLKHDTFETEAEMRVSVYVRQIKNETLSVRYESDSFTLVFGTR